SGPITMPWGNWAGTNGAFLAGYSPSGANLWAVGMGQNGDSGAAIAFDGNGHLSMTGSIGGPVDFMHTYIPTYGTGLAAFSVSGSAAPVYQWSNSGSSGDAICFDSLGHVEVGGYFTGTVSFCGAAGSASGAQCSATTGLNFPSAFIVQYNK